MFIEFTEEQNMLRDSVEKYLRDNYSFDDRQAVVKGENGFSHEKWQTFAELGWLAMTFKEESGGFGGGALETMLVCEQFGRHLVVEPYLETIVLTGGLLEMGAHESIREDYLTRILSGEMQGALAWLEEDSMGDTLHIETRAEPIGTGYVLNGKKSVVFNGPEADIFLVAARTGGTTANSRQGITLFVVDKDAKGVSCRNYKTYDGRSACELTLEKVNLSAESVIGREGDAYKMGMPAFFNGVLAVCAEAVGAMDSLLNATVEYTKQRKQFGRPISAFQVLRHRMAEMYMEIELTRSLLLATAWKMDHGSPDALQCLIALKAKVGKAGRFVSHNAIQLHGGIGTTDELSVGHYFKRIAAINVLFGSRDNYLSRYFQP